MFAVVKREFVTWHEVNKNTQHSSTARPGIEDSADTANNMLLRVARWI